jgi:hypothetical protein
MRILSLIVFKLDGLVFGREQAIGRRLRQPDLIGTDDQRFRAVQNSLDPQTILKSNSRPTSKIKTVDAAMKDLQVDMPAADGWVGQLHLAGRIPADDRKWFRQIVFRHLAGRKVAYVEPYNAGHPTRIGESDELLIKPVSCVGSCDLRGHTSPTMGNLALKVVSVLEMVESYVPARPYAQH